MRSSVRGSDTHWDAVHLSMKKNSRRRHSRKHVQDKAPKIRTVEGVLGIVHSRFSTKTCIIDFYNTKIDGPGNEMEDVTMQGMTRPLKELFQKQKMTEKVASRERRQGNCSRWLSQGQCSEGESTTKIEEETEEKGRIVLTFLPETPFVPRKEDGSVPEAKFPEAPFL